MKARIAYKPTGPGVPPALNETSKVMVMVFESRSTYTLSITDSWILRMPCCATPGPPNRPFDYECESSPLSPTRRWIKYWIAIVELSSPKLVKFICFRSGFTSLVTGNQSNDLLPSCKETITMKDSWFFYPHRLAIWNRCFALLNGGSHVLEKV